MSLNRLMVIAFLILTILIGPSTLMAAGESTSSAGRLRLSFPDIPLKKGERIVGFEVKVTGGWIAAVNYIPKNWSLNLDMDIPCCPKLSAGFHHGADALSSSRELDNFITIEPWPGAEYNSEFTIEASVDMTVDFEKVETRSFKMGDLVTHSP